MIENLYEKIQGTEFRSIGSDTIKAKVCEGNCIIVMGTVTGSDMKSLI